MKKIRINRKNVIPVLLTILCILSAGGCGDSRDGRLVTGKYYYPEKDTQEAEDSAKNGQKEESGQETPEREESAPLSGAGDDIAGAELFLIMGNDMQRQSLLLKQLASGKQYKYQYSLATRFLDKYGNRMPVSGFDCGRIIEIGERDNNGKVMQVQISDDVWEYPDVRRYSVDGQHGAFVIADTKYLFDDSLYVSSDGRVQELSDLTELDTLRVIGRGRKLLSVTVTTGHGKLSLTNTELFDGSLIQIGNRIFQEITGPMTLELAEGTHLVTVANDGYGGSTEVTVERGKETVLDLNTLKGEGPKFGNVLFAVDVEGAVLQIDGKVVDYSEVIALKYGVHTITVTADSYETYTKKLYVNSEEATIVIGLTGQNPAQGSAGEQGGSSEESSEKKDTENNTSADTAGSGAAGGQAGSLAGSQAGSLAGSGGNGTGTGQGTNNGQNLDNIMSEAELNTIVDELLDNKDDENMSSSDFLTTLGDLVDKIVD